MSITLSNGEIHKKLLREAISIILVVLSYFVPKNGELFKGNPKYLFLFLSRNKTSKIKYFWITTNKQIYFDLKKQNYPVIFTLSWKGVIYALRAFYYIIDLDTSGCTFRSFFASLGNFNIIQTWHGTALKKIGKDASNKEKTFLNKISLYFFLRLFKKSKLVLTGSETEEKNMKKSFDAENTKTLGFPRNDVFFDKDMLFHDYEKILHLSKYEKIILYAPTWRYKYEKEPFSEEFLMTLDNYLIKTNQLMLIKAHPYDTSTKVTVNSRNILDISKNMEDIQEILVCTDLLITDYSSVFFDFVLTNSPVILYPYDYDNYLDERDMYYDYYSEIIGPFAKNEKELFGLIKNIGSWFNNKDYQKNYQLFKDRFHKYQNGNSSERVMNYLMKEMKLR